MKSIVYVAGHCGMVGSSVYREYEKNNYEVVGRPRSQLDLTNYNEVENFFSRQRPDQVIVAAAKVGGIKDNDKYPVPYLMDNIVIAHNVIKASYVYGVKKLCFLGSVCVYPKFADTPVKEESLLSGELEPTNQWYAIAKISGIKMCQAYRKQYGCNYISVMPCNLYGVGDTYDENRSHVIPGLITKFHNAKIKGLSSVECWGTGKALREFMYVDDLSKAIKLAMDTYNDDSPINIGSGEEISIKNLTSLIAKVVGYEGELQWNSNISDGTPRRMLDSSKIQKMGWKPSISLEEGLTLSYNDYLKRYGN